MTDARELPLMERLVELWFDAARMGRDDMVPALLAAGVDIEATDAKGYTALVLASYNGQQSTTALLLKHGAAVDGAHDAQGNTALMGVCFKGYLPIAQTLIDAGADVNRPNGAGQTALMMAALFNRGAIIDLLLANGADAGVTDTAGNTVQTLAIAQGNTELAERFAG
ncbi:ankyrin repeat domain-containing protein [Sphingomonas ginsenosidivorax]|uniref:Ankyrin repeat domain-containing protein n=1 Tax=Sphingomonas ginsenosidivorax TaxID=862135 RepID=A0A5C6UD54_9SPHN|nr:ankyrin repeat domain-containing protein [Sphingomonas ginsenosidivorax]TXC70629.1 ankyrin repeat domain-containing protein [Sphingomonas ginsenosidivorax]